MENLKKIFVTIKNKLLEDKFFLLLSALFFLFLFTYWGRFGNPIIDCGREAYIPFAMADLGKVLFKDIICIYGPIPYYLNAFFVKIFGAHLNTMYFIGAMLSYIFLFGIFNLAKRFLNGRLAAIYCVLILFCCIFNPSISNYIFPYSYAIVYALVFAVLHLISLFNFIDNNGTKSLYISAFFLSMCLLSKLDFIPCVLPFLIIVLKYRKNLAIKDFGKIFLSFFAPFFVLFLILIFQKVSLQNLIFNFQMISNMAKSPSLQYFYAVCTGYFFDINKTFMFIKEFLISSSILALTAVLGHFASKVKNNFFKFCAGTLICLISAIILMIFNVVRYVFIYIPLIVLIYFIFKVAFYLYKKIKNSAFTLSGEVFTIFLFILFSILFSLKTLFGLFHELYGTYYLPFVLLSFFIILNSILKKYKISLKNPIETVCYTLFALFLIQGGLTFINVKNISLKTPSGSIFIDNSTTQSINATIDYIQKDVKDESVLVLPEGLFFNFALKKEYQFFNTSFTPMDFDAYGENYLTKKLLANMPKYIILLPREYHDYGKSFICNDFGLDFCSAINNNYTFKTYLNTEKITPEIPSIAVFERKNND